MKHVTSRRTSHIAICAFSLLRALLPVEDAEAITTPSRPVIFVHGISGSAASWSDLRDFLVEKGWAFGGEPTYNVLTQVVYDAEKGTGSSLSPGDFYALNMSDYNALLWNSQSLSFRRQGFELAAIISAVLAANSGQMKVDLVVHSMGGLAARSYLQGLAKFSDSEGVPIPYGGNVANLVMVDTPNMGSPLATICDELPLFCAPRFVPGSPAINSLGAASDEMLELNDLRKNVPYPHLLPPDVTYTSIVNDGLPLILFPDVSGDGIVSESSQDLGYLGGTSALTHERLDVSIRARSGCGLRLLGWEESHTCEVDPDFRTRA